MNDSIGPYRTLEELTGRKVLIADLLHALSALPRSEVLRCVANLSSFLERSGNDGVDQQIRLLHELIPPPLAQQIETSLKTAAVPSGKLFHRRQIWLVLQMALLVCKDDGTFTHDEKTSKEFGLCCLMASDVLKAIECVQYIDPDVAKHSLSFLMTALISYTDLSFGSEVFTRAHLFWIEMHEDIEICRLKKKIGLKKTLDQAFEEHYGLPLREFVLFCMALYVKFLESTVGVPPSSLMYDSTTAFQSYFSQTHIERALRLLSDTPDGIAARLLGCTRQSWATDSTTLMRTPLLELAKNKYVCPDLHMFRAFFMQGIFDLLMGAVNPVQLKQLFGGLVERYIERLMAGFTFPSTTLVSAYSQPVKFVSDGKEEACDGLLLWPSHAILFEYKSNLLTTRQRYAMSLNETTKAIEDQIATFSEFGLTKPGDRKERKGIGQLAYNLARILAGDQIHCNGKPIDLSSVPKLYPAVVVYDEGIANHAVRLHLQRKMIEWFEKNSIDHSRIGHALLFTIRDMEFFELLASRLGPEKVMKDYIEHVEKNPRDLYSMFHEYALNRYKDVNEATGFTCNTASRVLRSVREELERRKANAVDE